MSVRIGSDVGICMWVQAYVDGYVFIVGVYVGICASISGWM